MDRACSIYWLNVAADRLLATRPGLEVRSGGLHATDAANNDALRQLLDRVIFGASTLCIERPERDGWILMRARCLDSSASTCIGLSLAEATERNRRSYEHLDTAFGLTKTEHRVLLALLAGNDADALAAMHHVSVETIRTHIRGIYQKVGVRSREGLFARLQPFQA